MPISHNMLGFESRMAASTQWYRGIDENTALFTNGNALMIFVITDIDIYNHSGIGTAGLNIVDTGSGTTLISENNSGSSHYFGHVGIAPGEGLSAVTSGMTPGFDVAISGHYEPYVPGL